MTLTLYYVIITLPASDSEIYETFLCAWLSIQGPPTDPGVRIWKKMTKPAESIPISSHRCRLPAEGWKGFMLPGKQIILKISQAFVSGEEALLYL